MNEETIVAVFDHAGEADAAAAELAAVVPAGAVSRHETATGATTGSTEAAPVAREPGFWSSLFGGEPDHGTEIYDRSIERGGVVLTVQASAEQAAKVVSILERHAPIDLDERSGGLGLADATSGGPLAGSGMAPEAGVVDANTGYGTTARPVARAGFAESPQTLELAEESLVVGKRAVNRGTTRVRRFVVETPVEEQVTLRGETVDVQRRPVTDGRTVADADFSERTIEMAETDEEAVVSKAARIREEVTLNKTARERVETVRDTVRREDVKVETDAGAVRRGAAVTGAPKSASSQPKARV